MISNIYFKEMRYTTTDEVSNADIELSHNPALILNVVTQSEANDNIHAAGKESHEQWHTLTKDMLYLKLGSDEKGLTSKEASIRLATFGPNKLTGAPPVHWTIKLLLHMFGGFQMMMWFNAILCFIVYGISINNNDPDPQMYALAWVLMIVVIVTAIFQFYQEGKVDDVMSQLQKLTPKLCTVIRDGEPISILTEHVVPGD